MNILDMTTESTVYAVIKMLRRATGGDRCPCCVSSSSSASSTSSSSSSSRSNSSSRSSHSSSESSHRSSSSSHSSVTSSHSSSSSYHSSVVSSHSSSSRYHSSGVSSHHSSGSKHSSSSRYHSSSESSRSSSSISQSSGVSSRSSVTSSRSSSSISQSSVISSHNSGVSSRSSGTSSNRSSGDDSSGSHRPPIWWVEGHAEIGGYGSSGPGGSGTGEFIIHGPPGKSALFKCSAKCDRADDEGYVTCGQATATGKLVVISCDLHEYDYQGSSSEEIAVCSDGDRIVWSWHCDNIGDGCTTPVDPGPWELEGSASVTFIKEL